MIPASPRRRPASSKRSRRSPIFFEGRLLDPVTINLTVKYGALDDDILGQSKNAGYKGFTYDQIRAALADDAVSASDVAALLPASDPIAAAHTYVLDTAQQKALGLLDGGAPGIDGTVTFQNAPGTFDFDRSDGITANLTDFAGTVAHELSEILGRTMEVGPGRQQFFGASYGLLDLYHYSADGVRELTKSPGYFSIDGGKTNLDSFNTGKGDAADGRRAPATTPSSTTVRRASSTM